MYSDKNKYNSQQIGKQFRNRRKGNKYGPGGKWSNYFDMKYLREREILDKYYVVNSEMKSDYLYRDDFYDFDENFNQNNMDFCQDDDDDDGDDNDHFLECDDHKSESESESDSFVDVSDSFCDNIYDDAEKNGMKNEKMVTTNVTLLMHFMDPKMYGDEMNAKKRKVKENETTENEWEIVNSRDERFLDARNKSFGKKKHANKKRKGIKFEDYWKESVENEKKMKQRGANKMEKKWLKSKEEKREIKRSTKTQNSYNWDLSKDLRNFLRNKLPSPDTILTQFLPEAKACIEPVITHKFLNRFNGKRNICSLEVVYHGTNPNNISSIGELGLLAGGSHPKVPVIHGRGYGRGVYCSPFFQTAMGYTYGDSLGAIYVCLVNNTKARKYGSIWVAPDECCILPCYLIRFEHNCYYGWNSSYQVVGFAQKTVTFTPSLGKLNKTNPYRARIRKFSGPLFSSSFSSSFSGGKK